jgi:hypothetical protein
MATRGGRAASWSGRRTIRPRSGGAGQSDLGRSHGPSLGDARGQEVLRPAQADARTGFGIIKSVLGFRQFSLRGLDKVRSEWSLVTLACNIKRMWPRFALFACTSDLDRVDWTDERGGAIRYITEAQTHDERRFLPVPARRSYPSPGKASLRWRRAPRLALAYLRADIAW